MAGWAALREVLDGAGPWVRLAWSVLGREVTFVRSREWDSAGAVSGAAAAAVREVPVAPGSRSKRPVSVGHVVPAICWRCRSAWSERGVAK